jgi:anti-sigma factor RsiW
MRSNDCRRRPQVSLLVAGVLGGEEKLELERHMADCPECRAYGAEMRNLVEPLGDWQKSLAAFEVTPAARQRWKDAVKNEGIVLMERQSPLVAAWRIVWHELIWPSRYAWAGMAALWVAMLVINGGLSGSASGEAGRVAISPQEMQRNWEEQNRVLVELSLPSFGFVAPAPPPAVLRPRSERAREWEVI